MTFGEKVYNARLVNNISQDELADKLNVSKRTIYNYERGGIVPHKNKLYLLAQTLKVSVAYLLDDNETDPKHDISYDFFVSSAKDEFGNKAAREAESVIKRAAALFAGGELDDEDKELFMQSFMEVYLESKAEAREKFAPRKRVKREK